jgi:urease accessory protein
MRRPTKPLTTIPASLRAKGRLSAIFGPSADGTTRIASLEEGGGYRMRFPRIHTPRAPCEATIINTGGGMAGGDLLSIEVRAAPRSDLLLSTPAAERIYRSLGPNTEINITLRLEAGSRLAWLPQETILFSGARLGRRLDVDMAGSATLILAEATIFGRLAMGEIPGRGLFADRRRIKRDGRLVHAELARLDGHLTKLLARPAIGKGANAVATALMASPDAEDRLDAVRAALEGAACECGTSAWDGMLMGRFLAKDPAALRADLVRFLLIVTKGGLPRVWTAGSDVSIRRGAITVDGGAPSMPDWEDAVRKEAEVEPDPA